MEDILPKSLCKQCVSDLNFVYEFVNKCQESDIILKSSSANKTIVNKPKVESTNIDKKQCDLNVSKKPVEKEHNLNATKKTIIKRKRRPPPSIPYCDYCDILFKNFVEYREHKKTVKHPRAKIHECSYCCKRFTTNYHLNNHIRSHTKERPFKCELCSAAFANEANWRRHSLIHTGQKRHNCVYCSKCKYVVVSSLFYLKKFLYVIKHRNF